MLDQEPLKTRFASLEWKNAITQDKLPSDDRAREELKGRLCQKLGIKNLDIGDASKEVAAETRARLVSTTDLPESTPVSTPEPREDKTKFELIKNLVLNLKELSKDYPDDGNTPDFISGNVYLAHLYTLTSCLDDLGLNITDLFPDIDPEIVPYIKLSYAEKLLTQAEEYVQQPSNIGTYHPKTAESLANIETQRESRNYGLGTLNELQNDRQLVELMDQERYGRVLKTHLKNDLYRRLLRHFNRNLETTSQQITVPNIHGLNNEFYSWLQNVNFGYGIEADKVLGMPLEQYFTITAGHESSRQELDTEAQSEFFDILQKIAGHKDLGALFPKSKDAGNIVGAIIDDFLEKHGLRGQQLNLTTRQPWDVTKILATA